MKLRSHKSAVGQIIDLVYKCLEERDYVKEEVQLDSVANESTSNITTLELNNSSVKVKPTTTIKSSQMRDQHHYKSNSLDLTMDRVNTELTNLRSDENLNYNELPADRGRSKSNTGAGSADSIIEII